jgi:diadenosine tetraphosphate (Ap4A) HIT family hydrolase
MSWALDPAFDAGTALVGELPLSQVRLQLDRRWPWLILIPRREAVSEIEELWPADRHQLIDEIVRCGEAVHAIGRAWERPVLKLNVGALGNITRQLHVHVVGRRNDDLAWPGPVWGAGTPFPPGAEARRKAIAAAKKLLG